MAALVLRGDADFDPVGFAGSSPRQPDLGPEQVPRFVRLTPRLPRTATYKVLKRTLTAQRWRIAGSGVVARGRGAAVRAADPVQRPYSARLGRPVRATLTACPTHRSTAATETQNRRTM